MQRLSERDRAVLSSIFNPLVPLGEETCSVEAENFEIEEDEHFSSEVAETVRRAILAAETNRYDEALQGFRKALEKVPNSPAILNDRAQALRLAGRDKEAMDDLELAIRLSEGKGKSGIRALCQRGLLHRSCGRTEAAREDFAMAASRGSSFARTQLVELNPYAAMCNEMLREITLKALRPEPQC